MSKLLQIAQHCSRPGESTAEWAEEQVEEDSYMSSSSTQRLVDLSRSRLWNRQAKKANWSSEPPQWNPKACKLHVKHLWTSVYYTQTLKRMLWWMVGKDRYKWGLMIPYGLFVLWEMPRAFPATPPSRSCFSGYHTGCRTWLRMQPSHFWDSGRAWPGPNLEGDVQQ